MNDNRFEIRPLGFPWETPSPFLFCVYHSDAYPRGTESLGPDASLGGRSLGQDFEGKDGWRMYHGTVVPGFPAHPHRGFETVTVVRRGFVDHSDSLGAAARFGQGDAQWLTAGRGVVHSEMFPLLDSINPNPVELFQIWLNLPAVDKLAEPHFSMFWSQAIPSRTMQDEAGRKTLVKIIAGSLPMATGSETVLALAPPPSSWASRPDTHVAIWTITMESGARWTLPRALPGINRRLYFFRGRELRVEGVVVPPRHGIDLRTANELVLSSGEGECELLLLQGRPINEPVVQHGPFVMSSQEEIHQAFMDYQRTEFGGWPWKSDAPVHPRDEGRFARHADGRIERPR